MKKILIIHGPNLNLLGKHGLSKFKTLTKINYHILVESKKLNYEVDIKQSNSESEIIDLIHNNNFDILICNLSSFELTSIAIRDAITSISKPFHRVIFDNIFYHSNFLSDFNKLSYFDDISISTFTGQNELPYIKLLSTI